MSNYLVETTRLSGESFFDNLPEGKFYLEPDFVPLDQSIIWQFNDFFWKHLGLWQKTYNEGFEDLQPDGVSRTNRPDFVEPSAQRFIHLLARLVKDKRLPREIVILEQGPGSGQYAKLFLNYISQNAPQFFDRLTYVLSDTSSDVLDKSLETINRLKGNVETYQQKSPYDLPQKYAGKVLLARHSNMFDQLSSRLIQAASNSVTQSLSNTVTSKSSEISKVREIWVRAVVDSASSFQRRLESMWIPGPFGFAQGKQVQNNNEKTVEKFILENPQLWKEFWRHVKLEEKIVEIKNDFPYKNLLPAVAIRLPDVSEMVWSTVAVENLDGLTKMINWERGGYLELTGLTLTKQEQFKKDRRPKKYDGAIALPVNGVLMEEFVRSKNKSVVIEPIFGINQMMTIKA